MVSAMLSALRLAGVEIDARSVLYAASFTS
jgi:hypothetical protein